MINKNFLKNIRQSGKTGMMTESLKKWRKILTTKEFPNYTLYHLSKYDIKCNKTGFIYINDRVNDNWIEIHKSGLREIIEVLEECEQKLT